MAKRALDLALVVPGLVVVAPVLGSVALSVRLRLGSPVIFRQVRPGLHGEPFPLYKFRTMTDARSAEGELLPDAQRLTSLGKFLRSASLDELPSLLNVLKGDMSLIGPRPLLMQYLGRYSERQARRHEVRPGVTGLAQVRGRNTLGWPEKFELDVQYVEGQSLFLDLRIFGETARAVLKRDGINAPGSATMPEFMGEQ